MTATTKTIAVIIDEKKEKKYERPYRRRRSQKKYSRKPSSISTQHAMWFIQKGDTDPTRQGCYGICNIILGYKFCELVYVDSIVHNELGSKMDGMGVVDAVEATNEGDGDEMKRAALLVKRLKAVWTEAWRLFRKETVFINVIYFAYLLIYLFAHLLICLFVLNNIYLFILKKIFE